MLIFAQERLAYLAVPKTGSTAIEMALRPAAEIILAKRRKHMNAQGYRRKMAPFLKSAFGVECETVALMRDPVDQIRSWYKYRSRDEIAGQPNSCRSMSFDDYIRAVASDTPPDCAQIGSQFVFLSDGAGQLGVDHLFAYAHQPAFLAFMEERLKMTIRLKRQNVSPRMRAPLSPAAEAHLRARRAEEFALYDRLIASGGYLARG
jgi:hypothetical protein